VDIQHATLRGRTNLTGQELRFRMPLLRAQPKQRCACGLVGRIPQQPLLKQ
jgi:hypothetical protein